MVNFRILCYDSEEVKQTFVKGQKLLIKRTGGQAVEWDVLYECCTLCPRQCRVNRLAGERGCCGQNARLVVSRAALHLWEEPCITGEKGSGTVFFNGCSLGCVFCQNFEISGKHRERIRQRTEETAAGESEVQKREQSLPAETLHGKVIAKEQLAEIFLNLQAQGAANINLVTAAQFLPHILWAVPAARKKGLTVPIVYNTSGYEDAAMLRQLDGLIDIYLPDLKYLSPEIACKYSFAADYPEKATAALAEMVRQTGSAVFDAEGVMKKGTIVRHLVLPGQKEEAKKVVQYLHENYGDDIWLSILNQYTPMPQVQAYPELNRKLTTYEYEQVIKYALSIGVAQGFRQEGSAAAESFIPSFCGEGVQ